MNQIYGKISKSSLAYTLFIECKKINVKKKWDFKEFYLKEHFIPVF